MCSTLLFFLPPHAPIIPHNMSRKNIKHASPKANKSLQHSKYLASCFCKVLQFEQEFALIFMGKHNATQIPSEKDLSQAKDLHGKLKEAING